MSIFREIDAARDEYFYALGTLKGMLTYWLDVDPNTPVSKLREQYDKAEEVGHRWLAMVGALSAVDPDTAAEIWQHEQGETL